MEESCGGSNDGGELFDTDLNLYYLRARYYNPATGRFLSRDPEDGDLSDPKTLHKYLYASGDPVNRIDPSGRADTAEYGEIVGEIDIPQIGRATVPKGAFWGGVGLVGIGLELICSYNTDADVLGAIAPNLGVLKTIQILYSQCTARATRSRACTDQIGYCKPWSKKNRQPGDQYIVYKTINPPKSCSQQAGGLIFSEELGGAWISQNGYHVGLLRNGIVYDNIYQGGISLAEWVGFAYTVPSRCPISPSDTVTFEGAVQLGIGTITVGDAP